MKLEVIRELAWCETPVVQSFELLYECNITSVSHTNIAGGYSAGCKHWDCYLKLCPESFWEGWTPKIAIFFHILCWLDSTDTLIYRFPSRLTSCITTCRVTWLPALGMITCSGTSVFNLLSMSISISLVLISPITVFLTKLLVSMDMCEHWKYKGYFTPSIQRIWNST